MNTVTSNTEQLVITNAGTGPALRVTQTGANSIAEFVDAESGSALFIANTGMIGIGTTTPLALTHIYYDGTGQDIFRVDDSNAPNTTPFIIKETGYVGIGFTNPATALAVDGTIYGNGYTTSTFPGAYISLNAHYTNTWVKPVSATESFVIRGDPTGVSRTQFATMPPGSTALNERMCIVGATGYIGIGTAAPRQIFGH